ncbi:MAG TPA: TIGR03435 family protein, partial [Bryobacteraceae bacterium]
MHPTGILALTLLIPLAQAQNRPAFEVAAIKLNRSGAMNSGFRRAAPGELNALNITLKMLIAYAYNVQDYQIIGGPGWMDSERYDILAKPATGAERATLRARVQTLLADRFQLVFHRDTRELPIYALTVAKKGPKLRLSTQPAMDLVTNGHHLTCQKTSMEQFAKIFLQGQLHRNVVDKTGTK